jgi:hypothetical protein
MPFPIQALPKGLVGLLDLNTGGVGPPALADVVAATFDVTQLYALGKRERLLQSGVAAGTAPGSFAFAANLTVPQNEAWLVNLFTIVSTLAIGFQAQFCAALQLSTPAGGQSFQLGAPVSNQFSVTASVIICRSEGQFIAPPGAIFGGVTLSLSAATAFSAAGAVDFVRFRL